MESSFQCFGQKQFKAQDEILETRDTPIKYRVINFITIFETISEYVQCKSCIGPVEFETVSQRRVCFKIVILCDMCDHDVRCELYFFNLV